MDIRNRRRGRRIAESAPRLGLEAPDLGDHVAQVLVVDAAGAAQQRKVALGERRQVLDQGLHRRVETVALLELEREAFGERAREHPGRLEALHAHEHALDALGGGAEPLGDLGDRTDEISRFVQGVDQRGADEALGRVGEEDRGLALEMVAKGHGFGDIGLEVGGLAGVRADAEARPGVGAQAFVRDGFDRRGGAVRIEGVVDLGAEIGGESRRVGLQRLSRPVARLSQPARRRPPRRAPRRADPPALRPARAADCSSTRSR